MDETLTTILGIEDLKETIQEGIQRWPSSLQSAHQRARLFAQMQKDVQEKVEETKKTKDDLEELKSLTKTIAPLLREATELEKEGYSQVCFQGTPWSGLNSIPFALTILSIYKSYIVPSFSILLPLLSWIMPYLLLKAFYNVPIAFSDYTNILWRLWNGQALPKTPKELLEPPPAVQQDMFGQIKQLAQNGWTLFTIGQSLWQPIQQAKHFIRLDTKCLHLGSCIRRVKEIGLVLYDRWSSYLPAWFANWLAECPTGSREAFAFVMDNPFWLPHLLRAIHRFELLWTLSCRSDVVPCQFVKGDRPVLVLQGFGDPSISIEKRTLSSIALGTKQKGNHAIVTGPNRGGKSSFLRGVHLNVLLAHSFGACFAQKAQMTYFGWIADGLRLADAPGETSMFEREVSFAAGILQKSSDTTKNGLVLYDEIFHSTNPPDATRTSEAFCKELWNKKSCLSLISTHVYSLARQAPDHVQRLCLASWKKPNGRFVFSYRVQRGICEVSSVDLLLQKVGLLAAANHHAPMLFPQPEEK